MFTLIHSFTDGYGSRYVGTHDCTIIYLLSRLRLTLINVLKIVKLMKFTHAHGFRYSRKQETQSRPVGSSFGTGSNGGGTTQFDW